MSMVQEQGGQPDIQGDPSFEERLQAARRKQGLEASAKSSFNKDEVGGSAWGIGLRVGVELVSALLVGVAIGYGLDRLFHTTPILTAVFVPVGGAAGVLNVWRLFAPKSGT
jgi:ATP synthase protein I